MQGQEGAKGKSIPTADQQGCCPMALGDQSCIPDPTPSLD